MRCLPGRSGEVFSPAPICEATNLNIKLINIYRLLINIYRRYIITTLVTTLRLQVWCALAILKAILFYVIVSVFYDKKFTISKPFNESMGRFLQTITYLAIGIGLFSLWGTENVKRIAGQGIKIPDLPSLSVDGADVWLFMGLILLVIAQVFKKGMEIQKENELTV